MAKKKSGTKRWEAATPKGERVLGYFRPDTTVGTIAKIIGDGKVHKIETILAHTQKERKVSAKAALFGFRVLFCNRYPNGKIGKVQHVKVGHATVNFGEGTVQFHSGEGKSEIIPEPKELPKTEPKATAKT